MFSILLSTIISCCIIWFRCDYIVSVFIDVPSALYQFLSTLCRLLLFYHFFRRLIILSVSWHQFWNTLRKINLYSPLINEDIIHFEICFLASRRILKLYKAILETLSCFPIPYYLYTFYWAKTWKNDLKISLLCNWVQFAYKENIFRWFNVGIWKIA